MFLWIVGVESKSSLELEEIHSTSNYESTLSSDDVEFHSPTLKNVMELDNEVHGQSRESWEQENRYVSRQEIESLSTVSDEEVIGIITMEDVMEELLQVSPSCYIRNGTWNFTYLFDNEWSSQCLEIYTFIVANSSLSIFYADCYLFLVLGRHTG